MTNEKGQTLITVLLVSLVFTVLGLTIVSASINSNLRTGVRIDDIELTAEATKNLNEAIAIFNSDISREISLSELGLVNGELDYELSLITSRLTKMYEDKLKINDITEDEQFGHIDKLKHLTRIFHFSYIDENDTVSKNVSRTVYLAPTPSFLKYAIGSGPEGKIYLNGAAEIIGDLFTGSLVTKDEAEFIDINNQTQHKTLYPQIGSFAENNTLTGNVLFRKDLNGLDDPLLITEEINQHFDEGSNVTIVKDTTDFISVDFENTLAQIFNDISDTSNFTANDFESRGAISNAIDEIALNKHVKNIASISDINLFNASPRAYIYNSNDHLPFTIQENDYLNYLESSWLIIDGDLLIPAKDIEIPGNVIVTGNLIIEGNAYKGESELPEVVEDDYVFFDSTIYVMGNSSITNTNIKSLKDPSAKLILMSKGTLSINRINEFNSIENVEPLDAFFYTHSEAELYGVGSLFRINGGIFAKDKLTVNAIRQNSVERSNNLKNVIAAVSQQKNQASRFYVKYDKSVLLDPDRLTALPKVDRYQILLGEQLIK